MLVKAKDNSQPGAKLKWLALVAVTMLSLFTFMSMQYIDRFEVKAEQLLQDESFLMGGQYWQQKGSGIIDYKKGWVSIRNTPGVSHKVFQNVDVETPAFYRFSYTAGVKEVVPSSPEDWALATITVIYRDKDGRRTGSKALSRLSGTKLAKRYSEDLLLTDSVASIDFSVRLLRSSGQVLVYQPRVSSLKELTGYRIARNAVVVAWFFLFSAIGYMALSALRPWQVFLLVSMAGLALAGAMMPEVMLKGATQRISGYIPKSLIDELSSILSSAYGGGRSFNAGSAVSKLGHLLMFVGIGAFGGMLWRRCGGYYIVASIMVFAVATEALQTMVYGRTTNTGDIIIDCVGGLIGLVVGVLLLESTRNIKKPQISEA